MGGAGRVVVARAHHDIADGPRRRGVDPCGVDDLVDAGASAGGQGETDDRSGGGVDPIKPRAGDCDEIEPASQGVGQKNDIRRDQGVGDRGRQGEGDDVSGRNRACRISGLGEPNVGRHHRGIRPACPGAGGIVIARADHGVGDAARRGGVDRRRIGQTVDADGGAGGQGADQGVPGRAGEDARIGHGGEVQARAQGVGEGEDVVGRGVRNRRRQGVADDVADLDLGGVGALGVGDDGVRDRDFDAAVDGAYGIVAAGADHEIGDAAGGLFIDRRGIADGVDAGARAGGQGEAHDRIA
ncbi:hypothetical protein D3C73_966750 [compost metagenome]